MGAPDMAAATDLSGQAANRMTRQHPTPYPPPNGGGGAPTRTAAGGGRTQLMASMHQVPVKPAPGSSTMTSVPLRKASGGQVIGSTATALPRPG